MTGTDTIVALSSGALPSGVAVVRLSGPAVPALLTGLAGAVPPARQMALRALRARDGRPLDRGLVVHFPAPNSFTGEECAELHLHGSRAVVAAVLAALCAEPGVRLATAGEFTRRAFEAGKLDLTAVDGIADLLAAETETQREQALARAEGQLHRQVAAWRDALLALRAEVEAHLDFSDEGDVPEGLSDQALERFDALKQALQAAIGGAAGGRIARDGYRVVLAGAPNVGKSALLNALTRSDLAIVSDEAGTTRDVREVPLDLNGNKIRLFDVAGLRESLSVAEQEGVRRANDAIRFADLVLWVRAPDISDVPRPRFDDVELIDIWNKTDLDMPGPGLGVSALSGAGIDTLLALLGQKAEAAIGETPSLVSHLRDVSALEKALSALEGCAIERAPLELVAEALRQAADALSRLIGDMDAESVLDTLFSAFCIGK